MTEVEFGDTSR